MSNVKNYTEQGGERTIIEGELVIIDGGKLIFNGQELKPASLQANSNAEDVAGIVADFNALLSKLKAAGLMK
ncbi:Head fiber protein [Alkaliphilus transvaalensis]|uniref:Head fiber protein n=1 Tax=Alkaliphilus transvaalensis TaxID=114628 RepID=UPI00047CE932|nr:Head fiber protein [Alkaliphilus transvaalensis]